MAAIASEIKQIENGASNSAFHQQQALLRSTIYFSQIFAQ
jgi:hypothetical protein